MLNVVEEVLFEEYDEFDAAERTEDVGDDVKLLLGETCA
jgi:hypothetical protein